MEVGGHKCRRCPTESEDNEFHRYQHRSKVHRAISRAPSSPAQGLAVRWNSNLAHSLVTRGKPPRRRLLPSLDASRNGSPRNLRLCGHGHYEVISQLPKKAEESTSDVKGLAALLRSLSAGIPLEIIG